MQFLDIIGDMEEMVIIGIDLMLTVLQLNKMIYW